MRSRCVLLLGVGLLLAGCTRVGGSIQRVHTITLMIGQIVQPTITLPPQWVCTSTVSHETLMLRCLPQEER